MKTLEELKNTYKKLQEESNNLYSKIKALEKRNAISKFTVGDCYLNTEWNNLIKIVSIKDNLVNIRNSSCDSCYLFRNSNHT